MLTIWTMAHEGSSHRPRARECAVRAYDIKGQRYVDQSYRRPPVLPQDAIHGHHSPIGAASGMGLGENKMALHDGSDGNAGGPVALSVLLG